MAGENEVLWSADEGAEEIDASDPEEAVQNWLDEQEPDRELPDLMRVYAYVRIPAKLSAERVLDLALEWIDEEYGSPDDSTDPTPAMKTAADIFVAVMPNEYKSWQLKRKPELDLDVKVKGNPEFDDHVVPQREDSL